MNPTAEDVETIRETPENQLLSRRLMRKTPPSGVDEKHPDPRNEHVGQTPVDAPFTACVDVMSVTVVRMTVARQSLNRAYSVSHQRKLRRHKLKGP